MATTMPASNPSVMASGTVSMISMLARSASAISSLDFLHYSVVVLCVSQCNVLVFCTKQALLL